MKEKELKQIYSDYFEDLWVQITGTEEANKIISNYESQKPIDTEKYKIDITTTNQYLIYKNAINTMSLDEMKAQMEVEQAKNIRSIKKYVKLFYVLTVIALIIWGISWLITLFNNA